MPFIRKDSLKPDIQISGLYAKLANLPEPFSSRSVCCWTDLLGFGTELSKSDWEPSQASWDRITDRLVNAHLQCYSNLEPAFEFVLTLNDGIVRCCDSERFRHMDLMSMWLRSCVLTHNAINESEEAEGLPGARTVVTSGATLKYSHVAVRLDDFVLEYTKDDPSKLSILAQRTGNPVVAINPGPLQMNLAFSKAYLLESAGSSVGITGPHMFADESLLAFIRELSAQVKCPYGVIDQDHGSQRLFAVPKTQDASRYHLGFELQPPPIEVDTPQIRTTVWRVLYFFPWDEDVKQFKNPVR